ncbi:hypothetical protein ACO1PF_10925 [Alkalibacterium sp. f15]|uniref:hypothetical protein n=1 Tax=Alkalibacterium sp. f15 TaxID=3414029 RepID=UPI003BF8E416
MTNRPYSAPNPNLPADLQTTKKIKDALPKAEDEVDKTEIEKQLESSPEDNKPFNLDKVEDLIKAKEAKEVTKDKKEKKKRRKIISRKKDK